MTSAMSVYDFFGYTIPGGLYLFAIAYLLTIFQVIMIDFKSIEFSSAQIVVYTILAYIAGAVFDPFSYVWYQRFFKPDNISATTLEEFKKNNSKVEVKFEARDWPILLAFIRQESIQVAANIQRYQATFIMFRNIGFSLLIFSLLQAISLIVLMIINSFLPWLLISSIACLVFSTVAGKKSAQFDKWFYTMLYEAIAARGLEIADLVKKIPTPTESSK